MRRHFYQGTPVLSWVFVKPANVRHSVDGCPSETPKIEVGPLVTHGRLRFDDVMSTDIMASSLSLLKRRRTRRMEITTTLALRLPSPEVAAHPLRRRPKVKGRARKMPIRPPLWPTRVPLVPPVVPRVIIVNILCKMVRMLCPEFNI
jgi:hypothetical protein